MVVIAQYMTAPAAIAIVLKTIPVIPVCTSNSCPGHRPGVKEAQGLGVFSSSYPSSYLSLVSERIILQVAGNHRCLSTQAVSMVREGDEGVTSRESTGPQALGTPQEGEDETYGGRPVAGWSLREDVLLYLWDRECGRSVLPPVGAHGGRGSFGGGPFGFPTIWSGLASDESAIPSGHANPAT